VGPQQLGFTSEGRHRLTKNLNGIPQALTKNRHHSHILQVSRHHTSIQTPYKYTDALQVYSIQNTSPDSQVQVQTPKVQVRKLKIQVQTPQIHVQTPKIHILGVYMAIHIYIYIYILYIYIYMASHSYQHRHIFWGS